MKKIFERRGPPDVITTDGLLSYHAVINELGNAEKQAWSAGPATRVENSHLPFRLQGRGMLRFRRAKTLQKA